MEGTNAMNFTMLIHFVSNARLLYLDFMLNQAMVW